MFSKICSGVGRLPGCRAASGCCRVGGGVLSSAPSRGGQGPGAWRAEPGSAAASGNRAQQRRLGGGNVAPQLCRQVAGNREPTWLELPPNLWLLRGAGRQAGSSGTSGTPKRSDFNNVIIIAGMYRDELAVVKYYVNIKHR